VEPVPGVRLVNLIQSKRRAGRQKRQSIGPSAKSTIEADFQKETMTP
jgi:hypothetical protein